MNHAVTCVLKRLPVIACTYSAEKMRHCRTLHSMTASDMRALDCTGRGRHNRWVCSFKTGVNKTCGLSFKYERDLRLHKEQAAHARNRAAAAGAGAPQ